jgi:hypothetical protein
VDGSKTTLSDFGIARQSKWKQVNEIPCVTATSKRSATPDRQVIGLDPSGYVVSQKNETVEYVNQKPKPVHRTRPPKTAIAVFRMLAFILSPLSS